MTKVPRLAFALLVMFVLSGFAGLIYQSVWTQYLGLTLGHAAYAQTLVLAMFMGGMAAGAWLASLYSVRWKRLILGYAIVELLIGVLGIGFHPLFVAYTGFSQDTALPALDTVAMARGYQWLTAALLIAPQSILLGATFPLMSAGLIRVLPGQHGEVLGGLYFTNSLGAALGALLTTFVLLPAVGLPGTVLTAGILNIIVALGAWALARALREDTYAPLPSASSETASADGTPGVDAAELRRLGRTLVMATFVSGAASFVYEIGWVRLLNQALGTTVHSFELMLAAFILGLAFGGLWIRKRAASILEPVRYVGYVQVWMAIAALLSIPVFTQSFQWVGWIMAALSRTGEGYVLYEVATGAIALLVMFPAAFLAGMTLPLFTLALMRAGGGERSIGRIYAANTLGAIVGVAAMMHVLTPLIGVRLAVTLGALLDGLVGLYLLRLVNPARFTARVGVAAGALACTAAFSVIVGKPDPVAQASGVFRTGIARLGNADVAFLRDGKTATVSVLTSGAVDIIATNGKPDAGLRPTSEPPVSDEITMVMLGALPLMLHPAPDRVALIGWGSGLSTHTLLGSSLPKRVDTIEIEQAMVDGARLFGDRVARAYQDPRSNARIDDARTYFSTGGAKYDVIVSEPSNPWVSGVASLFTHEFYAFLSRHLEHDGMLLQWLHLYEIDEPLVATMLAGLAKEYPEADIFLTNSADLVIVARAYRGPLRPRAIGGASADLMAELRRVHFDRAEQLQIRHIGGINVLRTYLRMQGAQPHSDFFPTVSLGAPRTRFQRENALLLPNLANGGLPVLDILACRKPVGSASRLPADSNSTLVTGMHTAWSTASTLDPAMAPAPVPVPNNIAEALSMVQLLGPQAVDDPTVQTRLASYIAVLAVSSIGALPPEDLLGWQRPEWVAAEARVQPAISALLEAYAAAARRDPADMRRHALAALEHANGVLSSSVVEHMVILATLGAIGNGDHEAALVTAREWEQVVPPRGDMGDIRRFVAEWARGDVPACAVSGTPPVW